MPRQIIETRAVVLRSWRMGETSKLVSLFTHDRGKVKVVAKGARKVKSKYGPALDSFNEVQAVIYFRDDRELQTLSDCDVLHSGHGLAGTLQRLTYASAACELVDRLTIEQEANRPLYGYLIGVLKALGEIDADQGECLFWYFQLRLAEALGYQPEFSDCIGCRAARDDVELWGSAALGGGLCPRCGAGRGNRVSGGSVAFVRRLQEMTAYSRETLPSTPQPPFEIRNMLRGFLEYHAGEQGRLRSLEFLEAS